MFPDTVETPRLHLRRPVPTDAERIFQTYAQDVEVTRYVEWVPHASVVGRSYWGIGLMPEAIAAIVKLTLTHPAIYRVSATCDVENQASARALENQGFPAKAFSGGT